MALFSCTGYGKEIGGTDCAAVSVMLTRFEQRLQQDRKLESVLKRADTLLNVETRHP
jgi:hypothetical protein